MLTNPTPIETPAVAAKVYDKLHVYALNAIQPTSDSGSISVELLPATATGELASGDFMQKISVPLYPTLSEVPELAAAFSAILAAIPAVLTWQTTQQQNT